MKSLLITLLLLTGLSAFAQNITQTIKGRIIDKETLSPLIGATVAIPGTSKGDISGETGYFRIEGIPVGRVSVLVTYLGYQAVHLNNLDLTSGKELVLEIEMEEEVFEAEEVVISAEDDKTTANNEMSTVSVRTFSVEEAERYAGARNDVARMAANYAGVQGANDAVNDIVIRGNSPYGLLWRLEGVDIPNPNHFGDFGATGGPVSMLNTNVLANSDFFTGAFPSDYGNATSGVFDLKMRNGNDEQHEFLGQVGFNGFELGAEGPISKKDHSSYLVNARYSTLGLFHAVGIEFGTGTAVPYYQDISFKLNFPNDKLGRITLFGLAGSNHIDLEYDESQEDNLYLDRPVNYSGKDRSGAVGLSHTYLINEHTYSRITLAYTHAYSGDDVDSIDSNNDSAHDFYNANFNEGKWFTSFYVNKKFNARHTIRAGLYGTFSDFTIADSAFFAESNEWRNLTDYSGGLSLLQPFLEWQYRPSERLTLNSGLHGMFLPYNNSYSIEPRIGAKYELSAGQYISFGYGLHSLMAPAYHYFKVVEDVEEQEVYTNEALDFMKSHQLVAGYDKMFSHSLRFKTEIYYQYLYDVAVEVEPSSFSLINLGGIQTTATPDSLNNDGTGFNYGWEVTLEKFLDRGFYFLLTGSVFESKYAGSDGVERNTAWNGNFVTNVLAGKDVALNKNAEGIKSLKELTFDVRVSYAGGKRYTPVDVESSIASGETEYYDERAYSEQFPNYFRLDARAGYRVHGKRITQEFAIDIQNVTNQTNPLFQRIDVSTGEVVNVNQLGLFPIAQYRIEF